MIKQPQMVRRSNLLFHNIGFHQIINEVLEKPLSYIDLIFTSQTNMVVDSGVLHHYTQTASIKFCMQNLT